MDPAAVANLGVFRGPDSAFPVIGLQPSTAMTAATPEDAYVIENRYGIPPVLAGLQ
jgi:hypothetical protein